ncbi:MAG: hypothetical protein BWY85_01012 [Firmicutes bacterium ADurb.Bin506]|nr:MAG: hypothetical protein BWY85_01012 [Firmicutes bacterium ADurb.Bin506]
MTDHAVRGAGRPRATEPRRSVSWRITDEMHERFIAATEAANVTNAAAMREAVDKHIARNATEPLPPVQQMGGLYNVIVFFSVEQRDALRAEAARRGGTVTAVLREAMDEWLSEREGGS